VASRRPRLSRDAVLSAALLVIDEEGLEACTMRAVAAELGVEAMSLYWHVPGKEALLDGVVERVLAEVAEEHEPAGDWRTGLAGFATAFRRVILRHPGVAPLLASRPLGAYATASRLAEDGVRRLEAAGFDRSTAIDAARSVARYVVGFTLAEAARPLAEPPPGSSPMMDELLGRVARDYPAALFHFGLEVMLDGLATRLPTV
jgi:TetR/AcrR family transcriptional regulator, tetracycline repressor protein